MCYHQASKNATTQPAPSRKRQLDQASARRDMPATKELRGQDLNGGHLGTNFPRAFKMCDRWMGLFTNTFGQFGDHYLQ